MELVYVSVISGMFTLVAITMLQRFWERKWKYNFDFEKYKVRMRHKNQPAIKNPTPTSAVGNIAQLLPILQNLTPEQIDMAKDLIGGGEGGEEGLGIGDMITDFVSNNPEIVQSFLKGVQQKKGGDFEGITFEE